MHLKQTFLSRLATLHWQGEKARAQGIPRKTMCNNSRGGSPLKLLLQKSRVQGPKAMLLKEVAGCCPGWPCEGGTRLRRGQCRLPDGELRSRVLGPGHHGHKRYPREGEEGAVVHPSVRELDRSSHFRCTDARGCVDPTIRRGHHSSRCRVQAAVNRGHQPSCCCVHPASCESMRRWAWDEVTPAQMCLVQPNP